MARIGFTALLLLPALVALFNWGIIVASAATLAALALVWGDRVMQMTRPPSGPRYVLDTITISHFCEKVRWSMDLLGLDYRERTSPGTLRAFYLGQTVPRLRVRTGAAWTSVANSSDILRYLWAEHYPNETADFLEPRSARVELEERLDRAGRMLQVWIYYHLKGRPAMAARMWGADDPSLPPFMRALIRLLAPLQLRLVSRAFGTTSANYRRAVDYIESTWDDIDTRLADGRASILGDDAPNYTDYLFAVMSASWLQTPGYGGPNGPHVMLAAVPPSMQADIDRWRQDYPRAMRFSARLYERRYAQGNPV